MSITDVSVKSYTKLFPSNVNHSRNTLNNFGEDDESRLVHVAFLNKKNE